MPHGATSRDAKDFAPQAIQRLARAAADLRLFRGRGYGVRASLKLVGNHFRLTSRQRQFLYRCVSPPQDAARRRDKLLPVSSISGRKLWVDGHNCLIITESAIAGAVLLRSDDGVVRDVQGVYGAYRMSENTHKALDALSGVLAANPPSELGIFLDRKMRYAQRVQKDWRRKLATAGLDAEFAIVDYADAALREAAAEVIMATSDRENMDAANHVVDLPAAVAEDLDDVWLVDVTET